MYVLDIPTLATQRPRPSYDEDSIAVPTQAVKLRRMVYSSTLTQGGRKAQFDEREIVRLEVAKDRARSESLGSRHVASEDLGVLSRISRSWRMHTKGWPTWA